MKEEEFNKAVNQEIEWLSFYAMRDSRMLLTEESDIYAELNSIGYAKVPTPLDRRCPACIITCKTLIDENVEIDELEIAYSLRNHSNNLFTPLEVYWMKFKDKRKEVLEKIKSY